MSLSSSTLKIDLTLFCVIQYSILQFLISFCLMIIARRKLHNKPLILSVSFVLLLVVYFCITSKVEFEKSSAYECRFLSMSRSDNQYPMVFFKNPRSMKLNLFIKKHKENSFSWLTTSFFWNIQYLFQFSLARLSSDRRAVSILPVACNEYGLCRRCYGITRKYINKYASTINDEQNNE